MEVQPHPSLVKGGGPEALFKAASPAGEGSLRSLWGQVRAPESRDRRGFAAAQAGGTWTPLPVVCVLKAWGACVWASLGALKHSL